MKKNLFIHIGMPKTGSSAIQAFLAMNTDYLTNNDYAFPWHPGFGQAYQTSAGNAPQLHSWIINGEKNVFEEKLNTVNSNNIILSSEVLFHTVRLEPEKFVNFFSNYNIIVICYIRKIDNLFESCINQLVKNHELIDYDVDQIITDHDYASTLINLEKFIEKEKIVIRRYDKEVFVGGDIYSDFFDILKLKIDKNLIIYPDKNVNPSLNRDAYEFRILLNQIKFNNNDDIKKFKVNGLLAKYSVENKDKVKSIIDSDLKKNILKKYNEREALLNSLFFAKEGYIFDRTIEKEIKYSGLSEEKILEILFFIYKNDEDVFFQILDSLVIANKNIQTLMILDIVKIIIKEILKENIHSKVVEYLTSIFEPELLIMKENFSNTIFYYSDDIQSINPSIDFSFEIVSKGNDPYFSIQPIDVKNATLFYFHAYIDAPCETTFQLHYQTINEHFFGNKKFLLRRLKKGRNEIGILLDVKNFNGVLRVDPGTHTGVYKINHISVFSNSTHKR